MFGDKLRGSSLRSNDNAVYEMTCSILILSFHSSNHDGLRAREHYFVRLKKKDRQRPPIELFLRL
jgi:hypothetical protein